MGQEGLQAKSPLVCDRGKAQEEEDLVNHHNVDHPVVLLEGIELKAPFSFYLHLMGAPNSEVLDQLKAAGSRVKRPRIIGVAN